MALDPYSDPRLEPVEIPADCLSEEALDGLIESYCTQFHGLNDQEDPIENKMAVKKALAEGKLKVWFDQEEEVAALHPVQ